MKGPVLARAPGLFVCRSADLRAPVSGFDPLRTLAHGRKMVGLRRSAFLAAVSACFGLAACGPATTVVNDTKSKVWADIVTRDQPREPYGYGIEPGGSFMWPFPVRELSGVYIGTSREQLHRYPATQFCKANASGCLIYVSAIRRRQGA